MLADGPFPVNLQARSLEGGARLDRVSALYYGYMVQAERRSRTGCS